MTGRVGGAAPRLAGAAREIARALAAGTPAAAAVRRGAGQAAIAATGAAAAPRSTPRGVRVGGGPFDRAVDGLNRLPRPFFALGALGLFVYALADPAGFALRMEALAAVPEPLWWLIGAVVSFHFGAREAYHFRERAARSATPAAAGVPTAAPPAAAPPVPSPPVPSPPVVACNVEGPLPS